MLSPSLPEVLTCIVATRAMGFLRTGEPLPKGTVLFLSYVGPFLLFQLRESTAANVFALLRFARFTGEYLSQRFPPNSSDARAPQSREGALGLR